MHRETGAYHKKFLGHNQKWLTVIFSENRGKIGHKNKKIMKLWENSLKESKSVV